MKVKNDFVTNSSSTSYIFMIPPNFKLKEFQNELNEEILREGYLFEDLASKRGVEVEELTEKQKENHTKKVFKKFNDTLKKAKKEVVILMTHGEEDEDFTCNEHSLLEDLLTKLNLRIFDYETSGEGEQVLVFLPPNAKDLKPKGFEDIKNRCKVKKNEKKD